MPLRPLGKKVVGALVGEADSDGYIIQPFKRDKKTYAMKVMEVGRGCEEVNPGDTVILPESGWVLTTLREDIDDNRTYVSIHEDLILAVVE